MSDEGYLLQVTIKHGPKDDRGNPLYMTNVRGFTARDIEDHYASLAERAPGIHAAIAKFDAIGNLTQEGHTATPMDPDPNPTATYSEPKRDKRAEDLQVGEKMPCPVNPHDPRVFHERRKGVAQGSKKPYDGVFCNNRPTECAKVWLS